MVDELIKPTKDKDLLLTTMLTMVGCSISVNPGLLLMSLVWSFV
jgi:hypothetical protein